MKKLIAMTLATALAVTASAVPAKRGTHTVTQADGTTITVTVAGDEWHHSVLTTDGLTVARADDGNFYYRAKDGMTTMRAHDAAHRDAAEQAFVAGNKSNLTLEAIESATNKARRARAAAARRASQTPTTGTNRIPVIMVQYSDVKFKNNHGLDVFTRQYETGAVSARQYFLDQSKGKYDPHFDVYGPVTLTKTRATYGTNDSQGNDQGVGTMVAEACIALKDQIDWTKYDGDNDGELDVVILVYAGVGEASAWQTVPSCIWPCQWNLASSDYGHTLTYSGITIDKFAVFNELAGSSNSSTTLDGIGTVCHEFSHCLGLPDFYDTRDTYYPNFGMDAWSLMDYGCYNNDGNTPIGYSAYEKNFMGWLDYVTPEENHQYTLPYTNNVNADSEVAIKMTNARDANEYYILETRKRQGWDEYISADGMLVTHVTYSASAWEDNSVNNTSSKQRMTLIPADGTLSNSTLAGDLYGTSNHELTDTSDPKASVFTGTVMGQPLTEINYANGTTTLWYMKGEEPPLEVYAPVLADPADVTAHGFKASWTDQTPAENIKSYTLRVGKYDPTAVTELLTETFPTTKFNAAATTDISSSLDMYMDNNGWTGSKLYKAIGGIRMGTSSATGTLTTPALELPAGVNQVTAVLKVQAYNTDTEVPFTVSNGSNKKEFTVASSTSQDIVAVLSCDNGGKLSFATTTNRKRVIITGLTIYAGDASANAARRASETGDENNRVITDITDNSYTVDGLAAETEYTFALKAIYSDDSESSWVEGKNFTTLAEESTTPTIVATPASLDFGEVILGAEIEPLTVTIKGENLTGDINVQPTEGLIVEPQPAAEAGDGTTYNVTTYNVTLDWEKITEVGTYDGNIVLTAEGAEDVYVNVMASIVAAPIEHTVPTIEPSAESEITSTTFTAHWTAVENVASYNLHITSHIESGVEPEAQGSPRRISKVADEVIDITEITENLYTVEGLAPGRTYTYQVQAVYTDGVASEWSEPAEFTTLESEEGEFNQLDVNHDGSVNVGDVNMILDYILVQEGIDAPRHMVR